MARYMGYFRSEEIPKALKKTLSGLIRMKAAPRFELGVKA